MIAGRSVGYAMLGLAAALLAVAIAAGWSGARRLAHRGGDTSAVALAAADFVRAYGTFDHRAPETYTQQLAALTGGDLRRAVMASVVDSSVPERSMSTRVEAVRVTAASDTHASATVTAVQHRSWFDAGSRRAREEQVKQRVVCELVREDGRWLVVALRLDSQERDETRRG